MRFSITAWQSRFRCNRHFAFCLCITYYDDGTLHMHMWYSTLAFCIVTILPTGRSPVIMKSVPYQPTSGPPKMLTVRPNVDL